MTITQHSPTTPAPTLIHMHVPGDAPHLDTVLDNLAHGHGLTIYRNPNESYWQWGEPLSTNPDDGDTSHVIIETLSDQAELLHRDIAAAGILVDATLASDWASRITWGLGPEPDGWFTRYGDRIAL